MLWWTFLATYLDIFMTYLALAKIILFFSSEDPLISEACKIDISLLGAVKPSAVMSDLRSKLRDYYC